MKKKTLRFFGYGSLFYVVLTVIYNAAFCMSKRFRKFYTEGTIEYKKLLDQYVL